MATGDLASLVRLIAVAGAIATGAIVYGVYAPTTNALSARLDAARAQLRSDDATLLAASRLERVRAALRLRYASLLSGNSHVRLVRDLAMAASGHRLTLLSTTLSPEADGTTRVTVTLRGAYRDLIAAVAQLSVGSTLLRVAPPSMQRDGAGVLATIPLTLVEAKQL